MLVSRAFIVVDLPALERIAHLHVSKGAFERALIIISLGELKIELRSRGPREVVHLARELFHRGEMRVPFRHFLQIHEIDVDLGLSRVDLDGPGVGGVSLEQLT